MSLLPIIQLHSLSRLLTTAELTELLNQLPNAPRVRRTDFTVTVRGPEDQKRILTAMKFSDGSDQWHVMAADGLIEKVKL